MGAGSSLRWVGGAAAALLVALLWLVARNASSGGAAAEPGAEAREREDERIQEWIRSGSAESARGEAAPSSRGAADRELLRVLVVEDSSGSALAGARVEVLDFERYLAALEQAGTTLDTPAGRALRAPLMTGAFTGADGVAEIALPGPRAWIEARHGELFEFAFLGSQPADGRLELRLVPDRSVCAQVVDGSGAPRAGVPVALRRAQIGGAGFEWKLTESEAPDGRARFEHFQRRLRSGSGWHFTFGFPLCDAPGIDAESAGCDAPPVLALPGVGELRVRFRADDGSEPDPARARVSLRAFDASKALAEPLWDNGPWSRVQLDARGEARAAWIGLGLRLEVQLTVDDVVCGWATIDGPVQDGQVVERVVPWHASNVQPTCWVTGRFVLADGRPWPGGDVTAWPALFPQPEQAGAVRQVSVGDDGRFRLEVREPLASGGARSFHIRAEHPDGRGPVSAEIALDFELPRTGHELGDVLLDCGLPLVAGRVVGADGQGLGQASVQVFCYAPAGQGAWIAPRVDGRTNTDAEGRFELTLPSWEPALPSERLRLDVRAPGHVQERPLEFRRGAQALVVELVRSGRIEGTILLAPGEAPGDFQVLLRRPKVEWLPIDSQGAFRSGELVPGVYSVALDRRDDSGRFTPPAALQLDDVVVSAGETCRDPRLQGVWLDDGLQLLKITAVDSAAAPVHGAGTRVIGRPGSAAFLAGDDGLCRVRVAALPVDLEIRGFGFRPVLLRGVDADQRVVLERGLPVRLVVGAGAIGREPPYQLVATLYESDVDGVRGRLAFADCDVPVGRRFFDASGHLDLSLPAPGEYLCELSVVVRRADRVGSGAPVELPPFRISVAERDDLQLFELSVPQPALDAAVARALR